MKSRGTKKLPLCFRGPNPTIILAASSHFSVVLDTLRDDASWSRDLLHSGVDCTGMSVLLS